MKFNLKSFDIPVNVTRIANIHYFEFTGKYHTVDDAHDFCELVYVDRGYINITSDSYEGRLSDGQLIIHRPNEHHSLHCDIEAPDIIIIGFECRCEALSACADGPVALSPEQKRLLSDLMREGMSVYQPPYDLPNMPDMKKRESYPFGADQMIKLRLEMLLISLIRGNQPVSVPRADTEEAGTKSAEIRKYIDEHYTENIQLDSLCFLFAVSKSSLCRDFRNETGMTVMNYIISLRLKEAKIRLRENMSVTEVADSLGFGSIHYFCRLFKRETGETPTDYARSVRSKLNNL